MITERVTALLREEAGSNTRWLVAFSGGADSCLLLSLAAEATRLMPAVKITAWYLHHYPGKTEAARERIFARMAGAMSDMLGDRFSFKQDNADIESIARRLGYSWEHTASLVRRKRLAQLRNHLSAAVFTGHNLSDYHETLILRQQRKIPPSAWPENNFRDPVTGFLRPLAGFSRSEIRSTATAMGLTWFEDPSNSDTKILRNAVRAQLESGTLAVPAVTGANQHSAGLLQQVHARELRMPADSWHRLGHAEKAQLLFFARRRLLIGNRFSRNHFAAASRLPFVQPPFFAHSECENGREQIIFRRGLGASPVQPPRAGPVRLRGDQVTRSLVMQKPYGRKSVSKIFSEMRLSLRQRRLTLVELTHDGKAAERILFPTGVAP